MCLSQAGLVLSLDAGRGEALVEVAGQPRRVSLAPIVLDGGTVQVGDWVLIHTGLAVTLIDEAAARAIDELLEDARATDA